jgi:hypothetical protein
MFLCAEGASEISQPRSGWTGDGKMIRPEGTKENERRIPMPLQDMLPFCEPQTRCVWLISHCPFGTKHHIVTFRQAANVAQAFGHDAAGGGRNINANHAA